jgi:protein TonB
MFEQSVLHQTERKPWSLAASLTMQTLLIASAVLVSILRTDSIGNIALSERIWIPKPPPSQIEHVDIVAAAHEGHSGLLQEHSPKPFTAPPKIPSRVAQVIDIDVSAPDISSGNAIGTTGQLTGVIGSTGSGIASVVNPPAPSLPQTATQQPAKPTRVSQGVMEARIVRKVAPVYPASAIQMRISGRVHLIGVIAKDGTIQKLEVIDGHPMLVAAALAAVKQWLYRPTLLSGEPVEVITPIEVNFTLTDR